MKRILKILGIFLAVVLVLLALSPFFFEGTMEKLVKKALAKNVNATVTWDDFDLSLFRSFPNAALTIKDFSVINNIPFEGDTLARGSMVKLNMGVMQLFKSGDAPIKIDALVLDEALINIKIDSLGNTNYDLAIQKDAPLADDTTANDEFIFDLTRYELRNSHINYLDEKTRTFLQISDLNHEGNGDFSLAQSELETETEALVSLRIGEVDYLNENPVTLLATFLMDLEEQRYTFMENEARINELPLTFDGFVKVNKENNEIDISFKTPSSDFKNFLAVIPKTYVKELDGVTTTGDFTVNGSLKGIVDETYIPKMDIKVKSDNASFKYPDLPKAVRNISIDAALMNETGLIDDTYLTIGGLSFSVDERTFTANGSIRNLTGNALVDLAIKGSLDLAHIEQVFPVELDQELSGILQADVKTAFDMESVEKEQYQNIKANGTANITGFNYTNPAFKNPIRVSRADISMGSGAINLNSMSATSGQTDIQASGNIINLIPWLISEQDLKGRFNVSSSTFNVNDFMTSEKAASEKKNGDKGGTVKKDEINIPDFLDATMDFNAKKVLYDNLELTNVRGTATIKEEMLTLSNVTSSIFGGTIALSGNVTTKAETPRFSMELDMQRIEIEESFRKLELLKYFAPIANALDGTFNTTIKLNGALNQDLTPQLSTIAGDALARIITADVNPQQAPLLSKLGDMVSFLKLDQLSLRDVSTLFTFNNGNIEVKPFDFDIRGIKVTVAGSHGLDKTINYNLNLDVPAKYLGGDISNLLAKLDPGEAENTTVALPIGLSGTFTNPNISVNTEAAVKTLTQKLIDKQKQDLTNKGTDILKDIIGGGGNKPSDTTTTPKKPTTQETTTQVVKDILGGLLGGKKKDSIRL